MQNLPVLLLPPAARAGELGLAGAATRRASGAREHGLQAGLDLGVGYGEAWSGKAVNWRRATAPTA